MATGLPRMEVGAARTPTAAPRAQPLLEGVTGFRDLGGLPTRSGRITLPGVLFRSPCPSELTTDDRLVLSDLRLAVRIDLRASFELRDAPAVHIDELACAHIPILDAADASRYVRRLRGLLKDRRDAAAVLTALLREDGSAFARVFELLAERTPALVHCTTGRDRTGLVAALALRLAEVEDVFIAADYARSLPQARRSPAARSASAQREGGGMPGEPIFSALDTLDREWGGAGPYLQAHGCPPEALHAFRERFTGGAD